jgi:hypothetical protein
MIPLKEDNTSALGFINKLINNDNVNKLFGNRSNTKSTYMGGSISNYAKDLIMTFPCMCDNAIPMSTAAMISKANERYIITMLEMLFASAQMHGNSGQEVIASIHKNMKSNFSIDDYLDALDDYVGESKEPDKMEIAKALREMVNELKKPMHSFPVNSFSESSVFDYELRKRDGRTTIQEARPGNDNYVGSKPSDFINRANGSAYSTGSGTVTQTNYIYTSADYDRDIENINARNREIENDIERQRNAELDRALKAANNRIYDPEYMRKSDEINLKYDEMKAANKEKYDNEFRSYWNKLNAYNTRDEKGEWKPNDTNKWTSTINYKNYNNVTPGSKENPYTVDDLEYLYKKGQIDKQTFDLMVAYRQERRNSEKHEWDRQAQQRAALKDRNEIFQKRLLDSEVKKANELQPSLMIVNFNTLDTDGKIYGTSSFVAGVKSRLISVDSMDIIERIIAKNTTKINFTNFIKATTGEIRFVKDFLLSVDQAKIDAKNASKKGIAAMMWKTLENRSIKNNWNRIKRAGNDASAITVLVISQETVNALLKYHNFDITKIKNAQFVMNTYNLMGIIICDESIEAAKFLYAGNDNWEVQAYSYLEKEGKQATDYKKTINLLNKGVF